MSANYFTILFATDLVLKRHIKAYEADRNAEKGRYVYLQNGVIRPVQRVHRQNTCFFRHYPEEGRVSLKKSHLLHTRAIQEIKNQFENFQKNGLSMPIFLLNTKQGPKEVVPFLGNFQVKTEWPLLDRKIDVAILDDLNNPILLIEVLNTNKVSAEKSDDIIQFPWVEIKAKSILHNPRLLKVERHHRFPQEYDEVSQLSLDL